MNNRGSYNDKDMKIPVSIPVSPISDSNNEHEHNQIEEGSILNFRK